MANPNTEPSLKIIDYPAAGGLISRDYEFGGDRPKKVTLLSPQFMEPKEGEDVWPGYSIEGFAEAARAAGERTSSQYDFVIYMGVRPNSSLGQAVKAEVIDRGKAPERTGILEASADMADHTVITSFVRAVMDDETVIVEPSHAPYVLRYINAILVNMREQVDIQSLFTSSAKLLRFSINGLRDLYNQRQREQGPMVEGLARSDRRAVDSLRYHTEALAQRALLAILDEDGIVGNILIVADFPAQTRVLKAISEGWGSGR